MLSRLECEAADRTDPLAGARDAFAPGADGTLYFDANSVGAMPLRAQAAMARIADEWRRLRRCGWSESGWLGAPQRLGDKLAPLLGAASGQLLVGDSTSINLHKALSLALGMRDDRAVVITQTGTFPTDLYVAQGLAALRPDMRIEAVDGDEDAVEAALEAARAVPAVVY
ncbi:MAG: kynureninase, partial [Caldimonas sp.]